jgi:two-component sensor histidine kinase
MNKESKMLKLLLKVPKSNNTDFHERARFALTWRLCLAFCIVIGIITIITLVSNDPFFVHYLAVWTTTMIGITYMFKSKEYKVVSIFISLCATLAIISSILFVPQALHVIEILWMIVLSLFAFFTLGRAWGSFFMFVNALIYITYFNTTFYPNIQNLKNMTDVMKIIMSIEFAFALALMSYIMFQFYEVNSYAEKRLSSAFKELKKEKDLVDRQNAEKTVLLQEIHHRVKNNLQVIISLLRIQSLELKSEEVKKTFNEAINRIMTMSLIHQKMYEMDSLSNIDLNDYINSLVSEITKSYSSKDISVKTDIQLPNLGPKSIVKIALLLNDLITNSIKHTLDNAGKIFIKISPEENTNDVFNLVYSDNGEWKDPVNKNSFGLQLIEIFVEQLEGVIERVSTDLGTTYTMKLNKLIGSN